MILFKLNTINFRILISTPEYLCLSTAAVENGTESDIRGQENHTPVMVQQILIEIKPGNLSYLEWMMRSLTFQLIIMVTCISTAFSQQALYTESFEGTDEPLFRELQNQYNIGEIKGGKYHWEYKGRTPYAVTYYCNRLNTDRDYSVEIRVKSFLSGSEYGLVWGASSAQHANYFLLKGRKFSICQVLAGQVSCEVNQKPGKARLDYNVLRVSKKGEKTFFYINGKLVHTGQHLELKGKAFGMALWSAGSLQADDFSLKGTALPINLEEELSYQQAPEHLSASINSPYEEMTPVITPNGREIYFSRRFDPSNKGGARDLQDVYYSSFGEGGWSPAANLGAPINNNGPNAVFSVSPDGNTLLLMNTYAPDGTQKGMGLSISHRTSKGWSVPEDVRMRSFYNKSFYNEYFLSNDGKEILLAVNRDDTYGGRDLYVSFAEGNGIWSAPKNLGSTINSAGTELSPFLAADGKTLYFSSNGHPGYGRNDIFMSRRLDESWTSWSVPTNLGKPINSTGTDAYYSVPAAGDFAYYVSNDGGLGRNDIFKVAVPTPVKPEPVVLVYGKVLNSKTKKPISTGITYHEFKGDREVGIASSNPDNGYYEIVLPVKQVYSFFAEKSGFYSVRDRLDLTGTAGYSEIERDLYLTPIETGQQVTMNNVLFYQSKAQLIPTSYPELDKLARMMLENPSITIRLEGHTDNVGDRFKNIRLSQDRVAAVRNYLIEQGVPEQKIEGKGYGGSKPIADNSNEMTRRLNRRVEFVILDF
jgi:outer membrane protein OmpA-like peptidoglycan-associated protein